MGRCGPDPARPRTGRESSARVADDRHRCQPTDRKRPAAAAVAAAKYLAAKLSRGIPALAGEPIPLPAGVLKAALGELCDRLAEGGAGQTAIHIREAIENGSLEAGSLLTASLARDQAAIRAGATHRGLSADLVWLVAELAVCPVAFALQRTLVFDSRHEVLQNAVGQWSHGYCAACGSWPALAEVVNGHRTLRCSFCAAAWELTTYACVYCGQSGDGFVTAAPDAERKDRRVELCASCGSYLKTVDLPAISPFPLLSIADLETMDLDMAAMEHGYARPRSRTSSQFEGRGGLHPDRFEVLPRFLLDVFVQAVAVRIHRHNGGKILHR